MGKAPEEWVSHLRRRALAGDAAAQHELGWLYESSAEKESEDEEEEEEEIDTDQFFRDNVDENACCDFEEAAKWYRLAATGGDVRAQKRLAIWEKNAPENTPAVPKDHKDAFQRYLRAAEQQADPFAQCNVARYHALGIGLASEDDDDEDGKVDFNEAMKWFRKAADQGDAEGQFELGNCYANGEGVDEPDVDEATHWYRLAANQGHAAAQYQLACTLEYTDADDRDDDMAEIFELYRAAAEQGHAEAQCELGNCLFNGVGVERDVEQAIAWYRRAADQFHAAAHHNLALCYEAGEGVDQDREQAAEHYRLAMEAADGVAERRLLIMKEGNQIADETAEMDTDDDHASDALGLLRNRAVAGDHNAQHDLGRKFELGVDLECNFAEAYRWYRIAANRGNQFAIDRLAIWQRPGNDGIIRLPTDHATAFALYQRAAAQEDDAQAQFDLGMYFYLGKGTKQDHVEAAKRFLLAAEEGHVDAQFQLAVCYERGEGVEQDIEEAISWYAEDDTPNYAMELALYDIRDEETRQEALKWFATADHASKLSGALKRWVAECMEGEDDVESLRWYRMAAEKGDLIAQSRLADRLRKGEGAEKNIDEAVKWYRIAAVGGDADSATVLAKIYEAGDGVEKNLHQACKFRKMETDMSGNPYNFILLAGLLERCAGEDDQNLFEAFRLYQAAAVCHYDNAMMKVAEFYELGKGGVEKNTEEALRIYRKIAVDKDYANNENRFKANQKVAEYLADKENSDPAWKSVFEVYLEVAEGYRREVDAMYEVYKCYDLGRGVEEDSDEAQEWLQKAASSGHVDACLQLAEEYPADGESRSYWEHMAVLNGYPPENIEPGVELIRISKCGDKVVWKDQNDWYSLRDAADKSKQQEQQQEEEQEEEEEEEEYWPHRASSFAFSPAGDQFVLVTEKGVTVGSFKSPTHNRLALEDDNETVKLIDWSTSGVIATTAAGSNQISLWRTDGKRFRTLQGHSNRILAIDISPNGWHLASCSSDNTIRIWDIASGICLQVFQVQDQKYTASVAFSPNGAMLATNSADHKVVIRNTNDWTELLTLGDHRKYVSLDWSANSKYLATADRERLRVFSLSRANLGECVFEKKGWQNEAVFSPVKNQIWYAGIGDWHVSDMNVPFDTVTDDEPLPVEKLPLPSYFASTNDLQEQMERLAVLVERIDHPHALHQLIRLLSAINTSDLNPLAALAHLRAEIEANLENQTLEQVEAMITEYENARQSIAALSPVQPISVLTMNLDASVEAQSLSVQGIHAIFSFVRTQCWMVPHLERDLVETTKTFSDSLDKTDRHSAEISEQVAKHLESLSAFVVHLSQSSGDLFAKADHIKSILEVVHGKTGSLAKSQMDFAPLLGDISSSPLFSVLSSSVAHLLDQSPAKLDHQNVAAPASQIDNSASSNVPEGDNNDMEIDAKVSDTTSNPASQEVTELKITRVYTEATTDIIHMAISPDEKLFAACCLSRGFFLFDTETDMEIWHLDASSLISAFSPDGSSIIVAHSVDARRDYELKVYNSRTGELKLAFPGTFSIIRSLLWSMTDIILSYCPGTAANQLKLWHPDGTCHPALSEHLAEMSQPFAFSPNGDKLVSVYSDRMHVWDIASGTLLHTSDEYNSSSCDKVVFSPNGKMLALRFDSGEVWVLDASTWERRHQIEQQEPHSGWKGILWSPSSEFLASVIRKKNDHFVCIVRVADLKTQFFSHPKTIRSMQFAPNGEELLVGCEDTRLRRLRLPFTTAVDSSYDIDFPSFGQLPILHSSSSSIVGTAEAKLKQLQASLKSHSHSGIDNIQRLVRLLHAMKATAFKSAAQMMAAAGHIESELQKVNSAIDSIIQHQQSNHASTDQLQQASKNVREILSQLVDPVKQLNLHTSSLKQMQQQMINGKDASVTPRELTADELRGIFTFAWNCGQQLQMQMGITINAGEEMAKAVIAYDESAAVVREEVENNLAKLKGYLAHVNRCVAEPDMTTTFRNALEQAHPISGTSTKDSGYQHEEIQKRKRDGDDDDEVMQSPSKV